MTDPEHAAAIVEATRRLNAAIAEARSADLLVYAFLDEEIYPRNKVPWRFFAPTIVCTISRDLGNIGAQIVASHAPLHTEDRR